MSTEPKSMGRWIALGVLSLAVVLAVSYLVAFQTDLTKAPAVSNFWFGVQATGAFLTAVAILAAFIQVRETKRQLDDTRTWNKMSFALTFLPPPAVMCEWEKALDKSFVKLIRRDDALSADDVKALLADENSETHLMLKSYLNVFESYCLAINHGLVSEELAERIWGYKMVVHYHEMLPYITAVRKKAKNPQIYGELQKVCVKWQKDIETPVTRY